MIISHMQENFKLQMQELKDEKVKLIQILNKFLNVPSTTLDTQDATSSSLDDLITLSLTHSRDPSLPSKQYFEDFRLQITQALGKQ